MVSQSIYVLCVVSKYSILKYGLIYTTMLTCLLGANPPPPPPPGRNEASLEGQAECKQERRKIKTKERGKNLYKILEDYSEVAHMGASGEA